jgi:NAD(P)H-dependent FMN reductase
MFLPKGSKPEFVFYDGPPFADSTVAAWTAKIAEADAFIIVTPEYNHGTSAVLKNAIDYVGKAWNRKPAAFVSYGTVGGARAVDQLRPVLAELQMATIRTAVHIFRPWELLDTEGKLEAGALDVYASSAQMMLTDLAWWGNALQTARNQK